MLYDVIIIGAGVEGSATGYHLSKTNKKVLLLEQVHLCSVCVLVIFCSLTEVILEVAHMEGHALQGRHIIKAIMSI